MDQLSLIAPQESPEWKLACHDGIFVGTCSWAEETMLRSAFYPSRVSSAESRLKYYSSVFPMVEIDSSYYAIPATHVCEKWNERTPDGFAFNLKSFSLFTKHPTQANGLPKDLRESAPSDHFSFEDCASQFVDACWERFCEAAAGLGDKLDAVLFQFPPWFVSSPDSRKHIETIAHRMREDLPGIDCAIEFRHYSWMNTSLRQSRILEWLEAEGLVYVAVDEPLGLPNSIPAIAEPTSSRLSVVRFHGRNTETWNVKGISTTEKFNWVYSDHELSEWMGRVRDLRNRVDKVHVLMNNCHGDQAANAARAFVRLITGG